MILSAFIPSTVLAYNNNYFYSSNDILFYDENSSASCTTALTGNDNEEKIMGFLVGKGLTVAQAAGITGNLKQESEFDPAATNTDKGIHYGIAQWGDNRLEKLNKISGYDTLAVQLGYLWSELEGGDYNSVLNDLKNTTTAEEAARLFEAGYEVSGGSNMQGRIDYSNTIYDKNKNNNFSGSNSGKCLGGTFADGFMFYLQAGQSWSDIPYYVAGTVGTKGCGLTAMAMIITGLTGQSVTPEDTVNYMNSNHGLLEEVLPKHWGLNSQKISNDVNAVNDVLNAGGLVIVYNDGGGSDPFYANSSHYIVIRAIASDGKWLIGDSANSNNWTKEYDPTALVNQVTYMYGVTK
jgi:hypothetical protein